MTDADFQLIFVSGYQASGKTYLMTQLQNEGYCTLDYDDVMEDVIEISEREAMPISWVYTQVRKTVVPRIIAARVHKSVELGLNHLVIGGLFDFSAQNSYFDFYDVIETQIRLAVDMPVRRTVFFLDVSYSQTLRNLLTREATQDDDEEHVVWRQQLNCATPWECVSHSVNRMLDFLTEYESMRAIAESTANCRIAPAADVRSFVEEHCGYIPGISWREEDRLIQQMRDDFEQEVEREKTMRRTTKRKTNNKQ